jgi:ATP-binding protein involved in chromosome partitioning
VEVDVRVRGPLQHARTRIGSVGGGLAGVGSILAVTSGKGGVGKSTVAANLACALAVRGARVGLLDCDIHGPSVPTLFERCTGSHTRVSVTKLPNGRLVPVPLLPLPSAAGAPVASGSLIGMSYGWTAPKRQRQPTADAAGAADTSGATAGAADGGSAAILRGPLSSSIAQQLAKFTDWGGVDHLLLDLPPGTSDIHIALAQLLPMDGAVVVTTPQKVAAMDVAKGLQMLRLLKVPPLALAVNMAFFDPAAATASAESPPSSPNNSSVVYPFGRWDGSPASAMLTPLLGSHVAGSSGGGGTGEALPGVFQFGIDPWLSETGDAGLPVVIDAPASAPAQQYLRLATWVADRLEYMRSNTLPTVNTGASADTAAAEASAGSVSARYSKVRGGIVVRQLTADSASEVVLSPPRVRAACKCAKCVDEHTGQVRISLDKVRPDVYPLAMTEQGNYGYAVTWSDGHDSSIYTIDQLVALAAAAPAPAAAGPDGSAPA